MFFSICPRCEDRAYEILATHSYCSSCDYSPDFEESAQVIIPAWALESLKEDLGEEQDAAIDDLSECQVEEEDFAKSA